MDPLSITAACFSLTATITKTSLSVSTFVRSVRAARSDLDAVSRELASLKTLLELIAEDAEDVDTFPETLRKHITGILANCELVLVEVQRLVEKYAGPGIIKGSKWALAGSEDVAKLQLSLQAHKSALEIALEMVTLSMTKEIKADTQHLRDDTAAIKQDTSDILQEIARLRAQLPDDFSTLRPSTLKTDTTLIRYLDDLTSYAETVCWSGQDSDTDVEENDDSASKPNPTLSPGQLYVSHAASMANESPSISGASGRPQSKSNQALLTSTEVLRTTEAKLPLHAPRPTRLIGQPPFPAMSNPSEWPVKQSFGPGDTAFPQVPRPSTADAYERCEASLLKNDVCQSLVMRAAAQEVVFLKTAFEIAELKTKSLQAKLRRITPMNPESSTHWKEVERQKQLLLGQIGIAVKQENSIRDKREDALDRWLREEKTMPAILSRESGSQQSMPLSDDAHHGDPQYFAKPGKARQHYNNPPFEHRAMREQHFTYQPLPSLHSSKSVTNNDVIGDEVNKNLPPFAAQDIQNSLRNGSSHNILGAQTTKAAVTREGHEQGHWQRHDNVDNKPTEDTKPRFGRSLPANRTTEPDERIIPVKPGFPLTVPATSKAPQNKPKMSWAPFIIRDIGQDDSYFRTATWDVEETPPSGFQRSSKLLKNKKSAEFVVVKKYAGTPLEARLLDLLNHPSIVRVRFYDESFDGPQLWLEHINWIALPEYIHKRGILCYKDAGKLAYQLGSALTYCHANFVNHSNLKAGKILVNPMRTADRCIKLVGFRHATLGYENSNGKDVHYFGAALWRMICVEVPLNIYNSFGDPKAVFFPPNIHSIDCLKLLSRLLNPEDRNIRSVRQRISMTDVMNDKWMIKHKPVSRYVGPDLFPTREPPSIALDSVVIERMNGLGFKSPEDIESELKKWTTSPKFKVAEADWRKEQGRIFPSFKKPPEGYGSPDKYYFHLRRNSLTSPMLAMYYLAQEKINEEKTITQRMGL
ncbi:hypothetical protein BKA66DRAFT_571419 [Pyrenochaeta sp. MPI-SDFR-AT-0127]|nr:hypothetical protein BKA66DRAFT_571419 [Pyrenochaeta sp. MPI-SDFR-AT-0127]